MCSCWCYLSGCRCTGYICVRRLWLTLKIFISNVTPICFWSFFFSRCIDWDYGVTLKNINVSLADSYCEFLLANNLNFNTLQNISILTRTYIICDSISLLIPYCTMFPPQFSIVQHILSPPVLCDNRCRGMIN